MQILRKGDTMKRNSIFYYDSYLNGSSILCCSLRILFLKIHWHVGHCKATLGKNYPNIRLRNISLILGNFRWSKYGYEV